MTNLKRSDFQAHPFHLVSPSPWPLYTSISLLTLTCSGVLTMHAFSNASYFLFLALITLVLCMSLWWRDVISEGTYLGNHTLSVQRGLNMGVALFIVSEALFFLAIFWAYFHSALSPTVELGAQWPPMGIEAVNPFELPLINTVILLSSGFTVTYAHHSLIQGNRKGTLDGLLYTVILALIFTAFQAVEYSVSFFSISDGAFGSCFYFGTGFHGLTICVAPILIKQKTNNDKLLISIPSAKQEKSKIINTYYIEKKFLEWLVGFVDAEGNFNIKITGLYYDTYKNVQFTFQIGLHADDRKVLEYIKDNIKCGHISSSTNRVNFFVNDKLSLKHIILPIFNYVNLNSSKYHQFIEFEKAFNIVISNNHLTQQGKMHIINFQKEMQKMTGAWIPPTISNNIIITDDWLAGFVDGDGTFSTNKCKPRLKLENHIKELELYNRIRKYLGTGNMSIGSVRPGRENHNITVTLEVNSIKELKNIIIPIMHGRLKSLKLLDFNMWSHLLDIYYKGYHILPEGKAIFNKIKLTMNKYRLTSNSHLLSNHPLSSIGEIKSELFELYKINSPYILKDGVRYIRDTYKLVPDQNSIFVQHNNIRTVYLSISDCYKTLNIGRKIIKNCLITGIPYKGYSFSFI